MSLSEAVATASVVVVVEGSEYDARRRKNNRVLARIEDRGAIESLVPALAVGGLHEQAAWTMSSDPTLVFLDESGAVLAQVGVLGDDWLRWDGLPVDAPLLAPQELAAWMSAHVRR